MSTSITIYLRDSDGTALSLDSDVDANCIYHFTNIVIAREFVRSSLGMTGWSFSESLGVMVPSVVTAVTAYDHGVDISTYLTNPLD